MKASKHKRRKFLSCLVYITLNQAHNAHKKDKPFYEPAHPRTLHIITVLYSFILSFVLYTHLCMLYCILIYACSNH